MPPQDKLSPYLRNQIDSLKKSAPRQVQPTSATPIDVYTAQIRTWTNTQTPGQLDRSYTITEIINLSGLKGINKGNASVQLTGEALRRCGYQARRIWTTKGRNKRYWLYKGTCND